MAGWVFVQGTSKAITNAGTTGVSIAFPSNVTAGNVLISAAVYAVNISPTWTFSDTQTNAWTLLGSAADSNVGAVISVAFAIAGTSAADTPKWVNNDATSQDCEIYIGEFQHPAGTVAQDGTVTSATGTAVATMTTPAGNGVGVNDLLINLLVYGSAWASWGGAWATMATSQNGNACGYLLNAAGTSTPNANSSGTSNVADIVVCLQATGGGGSVTPIVTSIVSQAVNRSVTY